jgi:hypothetical protein
MINEIVEEKTAVLMEQRKREAHEHKKLLVQTERQKLGEVGAV